MSGELEAADVRAPDQQHERGGREQYEHRRTHRSGNLFTEGSHSRTLRNARTARLLEGPFRDAPHLLVCLSQRHARAEAADHTQVVRLPRPCLLTRERQPHPRIRWRGAERRVVGHDPDHLERLAVKPHRAADDTGISSEILPP